MQASSTVAREDLADALLTVMRGVMRNGSGRLLNVLDGRELSMTTLKLLMTLDAHTEELPVSRVAESLALSLAATSRAADDAVRRGLLTRRESEQDRRIKLLGLTADGRAFADELRDARREDTEAFVARLTPEQAAVVATALEPLIALVAELPCPATTEESSA